MQSLATLASTFSFRAETAHLQRPLTKSSLLSSTMLYIKNAPRFQVVSYLVQLHQSMYNSPNPTFSVCVLSFPCFSPRWVLRTKPCRSVYIRFDSSHFKYLHPSGEKNYTREHAHLHTLMCTYTYLKVNSHIHKYR